MTCFLSVQSMKNMLKFQMEVNYLQTLMADQFVFVM